MSTENNRFSSLLKNAFFFLLFLQFAPTFFKEIRNKINDAMTPSIHVGCIPFNGEIRNASWFLRQIKTFSEDKSIHALWLKINSPGGLPAASQAIFLSLLEAKKKKPIIAEIQDFGCSGAYYIALGATKIIALPSSLVGNIGVIMQLVHLKKSLEYLNMNVEYIKSGEYKDAGSKFVDLSPEQRLFLQQTSDDMYRQFIEDVARERNLSLQNFKTWADGKAFTGRQALAVGLVDALGSTKEITEAIQNSLTLKLPVKCVYPEPASFLSRLTGEEETPERETSLIIKIKQILQPFLQGTMEGILQIF